jgi:hypothetical protein
MFEGSEHVVCVVLRAMSCFCGFNGFRAEESDILSLYIHLCMCIYTYRYIYIYIYTCYLHCVGLAMLVCRASPEGFSQSQVHDATDWQFRVSVDSMALALKRVIYIYIYITICVYIYICVCVYIYMIDIHNHIYIYTHTYLLFALCRIGHSLTGVLSVQSALSLVFPSIAVFSKRRSPSRTFYAQHGHNARTLIEAKNT